MPDPEDGLLNEETLFDMSMLGDEAGFPNMMQTDIEPQAAQVPSHVSIEDVLKMEFFTPGEAREFYTSYSRLKGFAIRKCKRVKNAKGEIVSYTFVCNRQGFRHKKWLNKLDRKREHKPITRYRNMSDVEIAQMNSMREVGISIPKIYQSFAMQVAAGSRLCDIIWSDGRSQEDYEAFGDVLAFDATYGRNKYNLPVIVLSRVNHHNQTCVFAAALVSYESQDSYKWVLQRFLECMWGKAPKAVITDGDPSMRLAIMYVFSDAHHRLCTWHLLRNATAHVSQPCFTQLFKQCMLADIEVDEFEIQWEAMVDECGVREIEWVMDLYRKKLSWATAYIRGRFFAGLRTTSRCESLHAKLGGFVESRYGILDFFTNFQRCVDFLRDKEEELDFRSFYGTPDRVIWIPCVHIIVVLVGNDIGSLPETLVLKRWCKNAKNHVTSVRQVTETGDAASRYRSRVGVFLDQCKRFAKVACLRDEDYKVFSEKMARDTIILEVKNGLCVALYVNPHLNGEGGGGIQDPVRVRTKGTGRGNVSQVSKGPKKRKCSACGKLGHRKTRCPSAPAPQHRCRGSQPVPEGCQAQPQATPSQTTRQEQSTFCASEVTTGYQELQMGVGTKKRKVRVELPNTFPQFMSKEDSIDR
ncbi:hypothetical protein AHAS_Ahas11G0077500 [Arachis hypogaea]